MLRKMMVALSVLWCGVVFADDTVFYTQHNFWFEKGKSLTTNYQVGVLVPVNSKVQIRDMDSDELELFIVDMNVEVNVINVEKFTRMSMEQIRDRMLGKEPVKVEKFSKLGQENIKIGNMIVGMTKDEILVARGYPPTHATPSTQINTWTYWRNKFDRLVLQFENDKVSVVQN